jgi:hypothetical protein
MDHWQVRDDAGGFRLRRKRSRAGLDSDFRRQILVEFHAQALAENNSGTRPDHEGPALMPD